MHHRNQIIVTLPLAVLLVGCSVFTAPKDHPVIEDKLGNDSRVRTLALEADRRLVLVRIDNEADCTNRITRIVAEPSPDVMQNVKTLMDVAASLEAKFEGQDVKGTLKTLNEATREVARLSTRSQGIILFRDASYRLCEGYLNGAVNSDEFNTGLSNLVTQAVAVIKYELDKNPTLSRPIEIVSTNRTATSVASE